MLAVKMLSLTYQFIVIVVLGVKDLGSFYQTQI